MSAYLDLIFLSIVVVLIFMRLNNVLGKKTQMQIKILNRQDFEKFYQTIRDEFEANEKINGADVVTNASANVLEQIPDFDKADFLSRAAKAFEMVLTAFAAQDRSTLEMLVTPKLYQKFCDIIAEREAENITAETDLIRIEELTIKDAKISAKGVAKIVVEFITDQINVLKNSEGVVIEGDENFVQKITDVWTFERDLHQKSPVWLLTSTKKK